jgi:hypothetical protein
MAEVMWSDRFYGRKGGVLVQSAGFARRGLGNTAVSWCQSRWLLPVIRKLVVPTKYSSGIRERVNIMLEGKTRECKASNSC